MSSPSAAPVEQAMPGDDTPSTEIVKRTAATPHAPERMPLMTDDEIRRSWRLAVSLAASGMFKDARQGEQAFAKILVGRDLGLTATQALMGLHFVEGKIEIAAVMMGTFVRSRDGYDYRLAWIKETPPARQGERAVREAVYADEDTAADLRPVVGCALEFTVDGQMRGVSTFTVEDAERAGLTKDRGSAKSNYVKYPRNMLFARAMSNGCKWLISEVLAGLPVYVEGEVEAQKALGDGDGDGQPVGLDLGPDVEKVIARAVELGHAALADRATVEMTLGEQPPSKVVAWVRAANKELDALPQDAEVVDGEPADAAQGVVSPSVAQTPDPRQGAADGPQAPPQPAEAPESTQASSVDTPAPDPQRIEAMGRRASQLLNDADALEARGDDAAATDARDEAEALILQIEAASNPDQGALL
jgi:hypothetical protein